MSLQQTSLAALLPSEVLAEIALITVVDDTTPRTWLPLPVLRNTVWHDLEAWPAETLQSCCPLPKDCLSSGFIERAVECSMLEEPFHVPNTAIPQRPPGYYHTAFICARVCRSWRYAILSHRAIWAIGGLLNLGFVGQSRQLAGPFASRLTHPRPLCPCFLPHCLFLLGKAEDISFTTYGHTGPHSRIHANVTVSEVIFAELLAASVTQDGCSVQTLDIQLLRYMCWFKNSALTCH